MAAYAPIKIRYNLNDTYPDTAQRNWVGAQSTAGRRGWWNNFADTSNATLAMFIDQQRYLYYAAGNTLKKRDILLGVTTSIATVTGGVPVIDCIFVDSLYIYIGGGFTTVLGSTRNGLARIAKSDLTIVDAAWNPNMNGRVHWITGNPEGTGTAIYVGGTFTDVNSGTTRNRAAAFDGSGVATAWNPNLDGPAYAGKWLVAGTDGLAESIIMGGTFTKTGTGVVSPLEVTTTGAGSLTSWYQGGVAGGNNTVRAIEIDVENEMVYFGGDFTTVFVPGATTRNKAAAISYAGTLSSFNPNVSTTTVSHSVWALALNENYVYMGGLFTTVGGTARVNIAKVTKASGALEPFYPPLTGGLLNQALAVFDRTVYVGGDYTGVGACYPVGNGITYGAYLNAFPDPLFTDTNAFFVAKAGADTNAGTFAAPFLTIEKGRDALTGAFVYVVIKDSGEYSEVLTWTDAGTGLYALDGFTPTIAPHIGAVTGTYGARVSGRTQFSTGAAGTFCYVSKSGDNGTGSRGNSALPFLTIGAAIVAASSGDTIQIQDNGTYVEDIDTGAKALIIQAKDGQVPTLVNVLTGGSDEHFKANAGVALSVYGLNIRDVKGSAGWMFNGNFPLDIYDCTLSGATNAINISGSARALNIYNTSFSGFTQSIANPQGTQNIINCFFNKCVGPTPTSLSTSFVMTSCSLIDCLRWGVNNGSSGAFPASTVISFCLIDGATFTTGSDGDGLILNGVFTVHDCIIKNCEVCGILSGSCVGTIYNVLFSGNSTSSGSFLADISGVVSTGLTVNFTISNCTSLNSGQYGLFTIDTSGGGATVVVAISNFTIINAATRSIYFNNTASATTVTANGIAEYGSTQGIVAAVAGLSVSNSIVDSPNQDVTVTRTGNPAFASTTDGFIDTSIGATSPGILYGNATSTTNVGNMGAVFNISALNVAIDGITFSGDKNLYVGVKETLDTYNSTIRYCSFENLTTVGVFKLSPGEVSNCLFMNNGFGVQLNNTNNLVHRNAFVQNSTCGILNASFGATITHNSVYGCPYGQYDFNDVSASAQSDNVYSDNSVYDYYGISEQAYACIGTLGNTASVDANSTRLNPLFVDPENQDLRLQAIAAGNFFNSPAKGAGSDGDDMGAFDFDYGDLVPDYDELEMVTPNRNPDIVERIEEAIKLAEGVQEDGRTYTAAATFKMGYSFKWNQSSNDMPDAQVEALKAAYISADGKIQLDMGDGAGFVDAFILRETPFEYTDMTGGYSDDDVPTPVRELSIRVA